MNSKLKIKNCCFNHPARIAAVSVKGVNQCWQCYLGTKAFLKRFGSDYYPDFNPSQPATAAELTAQRAAETKQFLTTNWRKTHAVMHVERSEPYQ